MRLTLQTQLVEDVAVIRCKGRIVLGVEARALQDELDKQTELRKKVVLNLAEADYLDSFGLGYLVRALNVLRAAGGDLKLCEVNPSVLKVLRITNLVPVFAPFPSEREAIDAFSVGRRSDRPSTEPSRGKILCVDTSPDLLAFVSALLKRAGYEVLTSRYLGEAQTLVNVMRPNVVICGAGIPELAAGAEALERFRQSGHGIQVLNLPADFSIAEAGQAGADLVNRVQSLLTT
jgi:anti-sigma B factor antagonist